MLNEKVKELLNQQVNKEFYSAYLYLDFSNYFEARGLDGFANWYEIQAREEQDHAMLFYHYLQNNSQAVTLKAIDKPDKTFTGAGGAYECDLLTGLCIHLDVMQHDLVIIVAEVHIVKYHFTL